MTRNIFIQNGESVTISNKKHWYHSIKWKLFVSVLLICFVQLLFFYNTILVSIEDYFISISKNKLLQDALIIATRVSDSGYLADLTNEEAIKKLDADMDLRSKENGYRIIVLDDRCYVLTDSNKQRTGTTILVPEVINALTKKNDVGIRDTETEMSVYASASVENAEMGKRGAVLLVTSAKSAFEYVAGIERSLFVFTLLAGVILGVLVFFVSQLVLDPLSNVLKVVQKMADGHLDQRFTVKGYDEYSRLGQAFNEMVEKLEQVEKSRAEFVSNVSHELKTPLSSIKVLSESILFQEGIPIETYREFLIDINSEVDRMTLIVNDLLNLVKLDQREVGLNIKQVELNYMVESLLKRLYPLAEQKNIELLYDDVRKVVIDADEIRLTLAITNLVENGIKYTPPHGTVKVIVDADYQNAFISVIDTGTGISEEEQGKVFNRFYRIDKTRDRDTGGTGLGLSIARAAVLLHNGSIRLISKENEGTTFIVRIPINYNAVIDNA